MKVLQLMERTGLRSPNKAFAYIADGLLEIQTRVPENTKRHTFSIAADTRFYTLPSDFVKLNKVYRKYDADNKYVEIQRVMHVNLMQDSSSSTATSDDDLIVL